MFVCLFFFCSETLVFIVQYIFEFVTSNFNKHLLFLRSNSIPRAHEMCVYICSRSYFGASYFKRFECDCHEITLVRMCRHFSNYFIFSINCNPDLDDTICDCLFKSMATIFESDHKSSFIFVGNTNAHYQKWLASVLTKNLHSQAALDFCNSC